MFSFETKQNKKNGFIENRVQKKEEEKKNQCRKHFERATQ